MPKKTSKVPRFHSSTLFLVALAQGHPDVPDAVTGRALVAGRGHGFAEGPLRTGLFPDPLGPLLPGPVQRPGAAAVVRAPRRAALGEEREQGVFGRAVLRRRRPDLVGQRQ